MLLGHSKILVGLQSNSKVPEILERFLHDREISQELIGKRLITFQLIIFMYLRL
jgi:hypothetical protein